MVVPDHCRARYRTAAQIKVSGAIGKLRDGAQITAHGVATRLLAWPGTGFQTEAVHVVTVQPNEQSEHWCYDLAEDALLCHSGHPEVLLRGAWVGMAPGDLAYVPPGRERAIRNTTDTMAILVNQITPPQIDLYIDHGLYNADMGVFNYDSAHKATTNAVPSQMAGDGRFSYQDTSPEVRAWNLSVEDVRRDGALFNVYRGTPYSGIGLPMRLVLWPGAGSRTSGFNFAYGADGVEDVIHKHPVADECLVIWAGRGRFYMGDRWVEVEAGDAVLAPCGVAHGHVSVGPALFGGFASPPQLDLVIPDRGVYRDGRFVTTTTTTELTVDI